MIEKNMPIHPQKKRRPADPGPRLFFFVGGEQGGWMVQMKTNAGDDNS